MIPPNPEHDAFEQIREFVRNKLGLDFDEQIMDRLRTAISQRIEVTKIARLEDYFRKLNTSDANESELNALARELTIGETYFFRHLDQLEAFVEVATSSIRAAREHHRSFRILSAGCSTGEEAYSLVMLILKQFQSFDNLRIIGIDLNLSSIEKAKAAKYSPWSLREVPDNIKAKFFETDGKNFLLSDKIKQKVSFEVKNLMSEDPAFWQENSFDAIFCRNVLIYFSPEAREKIIRRFFDSLSAHGHLILGHSETLRGISKDFHLVHFKNAFFYSKKEGLELKNWAPERVIAPIAKEPELDASWVEVIGRSATQIDQLSHSRKSTPKAHGAPLPQDDRKKTYREILELFAEERLSEALSRMNTMRANVGDDSDLLLLRALLLTNTGDSAAATSTCLEILKSDDMNPYAHFVLAMCYENSGDRKRALEENRIALYLDTSFAMAYFHLGLLMKRAGDMGSARREFSQALNYFAHEDASRILLFGGGFNRESLMGICRAELEMKTVTK